MGQLIRQIKKKNGLIRRFAEEEDACRCCGDHSDSCSPDRACHIFKEQLTELVQSILFKDRQTE